MTCLIAGARGKIKDIDLAISKLREIEEKHKLVLQVFDARLIYGENHLNSAVNRAERAVTMHTNLAKSFGMEIMLYASGERQISQAIEKMGVKHDTDSIGLIIYDRGKIYSTEDLKKLCDEILNELEFIRDDSVLVGDKKVLERFGISGAELNAVPESHWPNLILERVALVDIIK